MTEIISLLWAVFVIVVVLVLAYLFTRFVAGHAGGDGLMRSRSQRMTVLERITVGKDQKLLLVRLGDAYYFLGVSQGSVTNLGQVPAEEAAQWEAEEKAQKDSPSRMGFQEALRKVLEQRNREGN